MDINKVIYLGHKARVPLIRLPSELADGFEPHGHIGYDLGPDHDRAVRCRRGGVYPGSAGWEGGWVGYTGTHPPALQIPIFHHI